MRLMKKSWIQVLISILLISIILIGFWGKEIHAESGKDLLSSGYLSDEFEIRVEDGIYLKELKPKYEGNILSFVGKLVNDTDKVAQVKLSGKLLLDGTKEEIGISFENEIGPKSTIENVAIKTAREIPNLDLNQSVKRDFKSTCELLENTGKQENEEKENKGKIRKDGYLKDIFLIAVPTVCLIISYLIWNAFGRDKKVEKKNTYYPLKDVNSMELAYLFQDKCDNNDIASLIVYLANEGFITIEETDLKDGYKNKVFKLKKVKEYDLKDINEKLVMEILFKDKKEITTDSIGNTLGDIKKEIKANMEVKYSDEKIYTKGEVIRKIYLSILILISVLVIMICPKVGIVKKLFGIKEIIVSLVFILFGIMPAFLDIKTKRAEKLELYIYMAIDILLTVAFVYFMRKSVFVSRHLYEVAFSGGLIVVMLLLLYLMPKKKEKYAEKYQRIVEFKDFMKNGDANTIEELIKKDGEYYYKILPYATSLEVEDEWVSKAEGLIKKWPKWFKKQNDKFDTEKFLRKYKKIIETLEFYAGNK